MIKPGIGSKGLNRRWELNSYGRKYDTYFSDAAKKEPFRLCHIMKDVVIDMEEEKYVIALCSLNRKVLRV